MSAPHLALQALRRQFPTWAFLHNPFADQWFALQGRQTTLTAATPEELASRVARFQARPAIRPQRRR